MLIRVQHTETSHFISSALQTCAHRYEKRQYVNTAQETRDIFGRCYVLSQDLTIKDDMENGAWSFCEGRLRGHEKFGSCQQGVAATFTKDYHYIVFGAPGTYNWKGKTASFLPTLPISSEVALKGCIPSFNKFFFKGRGGNRDVMILQNATLLYQHLLKLV